MTETNSVILYVTRQEFELFKDSVRNQFNKIDTNYSKLESSYVELNKTINTVNTDTKLILQKLDLFMDSNSKNIQEFNGRVEETESRVMKLEEGLNEHVNINPRKEYQALSRKILWLFLSSILTSVLASFAIFG